jgi:hypothetical protein
MPFTRYKQVSLGAGRSGLATVGYALYDATGAVAAARSTVGIAERGATGTYGAVVTFPDNFVGEIRWDSGEAAPRTASEEINPGGISEYLDNRITSRPDAAAIDTQLTSAHGAGPWTRPSIPTPPSVADIDTQLISTHGSGSWTQPTIPTPPTPADIDATLTAAHGVGDWTQPTIPPIPTPADISAQVGTDLTAAHGAGAWTGGTGTAMPLEPPPPPEPPVGPPVGPQPAGPVAVDHDTGGTDAMRFVGATGAGIAGASVRIYDRADWDAGRRAATSVRASTGTRPDGRWTTPLMLDPGDYAVLISYPGFQPSVTYITV